MRERKQKTGSPADEALTKLRERTGLNQTEFWNRLGVTQSGGSRYESGRGMPKPVQTLLKIAYGSQADALKLVADLRGGEKQQQPNA